MKNLLLSVALCASLFACGKKKDDGAAADDKAVAADKKAPEGDKAAPAGDLANVDCEALTKHSTELLINDAKATKSADEAKAIAETLEASHAEQVKGCEADKGSKPMTKKQYDCYMGVTTGMVDAAKCLQ